MGICICVIKLLLWNTILHIKTRMNVVENYVGTHEDHGVWKIEGFPTCKETKIGFGNNKWYGNLFLCSCSVSKDVKKL